MPLVTQAEIEPLIPTFKLQLRQAGNFEIFESSAAIIVVQHTGITIPDDASDRPAALDWAVQPMAWIIAYIASGSLQNVTDYQARKLEKDYDKAIALLAKRPLTDTTGHSALTGTIEGLYE